MNFRKMREDICLEIAEIREFHHLFYIEIKKNAFYKQERPYICNLLIKPKTQLINFLFLIGSY